MKCMISLMMTSSFLYKIWNVLLTATPLIIDAGKTKSHSVIKQRKLMSIVLLLNTYFVQLFL